MCVMVQKAHDGGWGGCRSTPPLHRARVAGGGLFSCRPRRHPTGRIGSRRCARTRRNRRNRPGWQHHLGMFPRRTCRTRPAFSKIGVEDGGHTHSRTRARHTHRHMSRGSRTLESLLTYFLTYLLTYLLAHLFQEAPPVWRHVH